MSGNSTFLLGLAAAIPLSIIANLATIYLQRWYAQRPGRRISLRIADLERRISSAERAIATNITRSEIYLRVVLDAIQLGSLVAAVWATAVLNHLLTTYLPHTPAATAGFDRANAAYDTVACVCTIAVSLVVLASVIRALAKIRDLDELAALRGDLANLRRANEHPEPPGERPGAVK